MLPEFTSPPAAWTVSARLSMVSVSSASSRMLRTEYAQVYGSPTLVGLAQPLVNPIPCWTSAARATPGPIVSAASIAAASTAPSRLVTCIQFPPMESRSGKGNTHRPLEPAEYERAPKRLERFDGPARSTSFLRSRGNLRGPGSVLIDDRRYWRSPASRGNGISAFHATCGLTRSLSRYRAGWRPDLSSTLALPLRPTIVRRTAAVPRRPLPLNADVRIGPWHRQGVR